MSTPGPQGLDVLDIARELVRIPNPNPPGDESAAAALVQDLLPALQLPGARVITRHESRPNLLVTLDFGPGGGTWYSRDTSTPSP
jgi:succinyl-diaminopimelate desuccinylase